MTEMNDNQSMLVILGEVRGGVAAIIRSQHDLTKRVEDMETRLYGHIKRVDSSTTSRLDTLNSRVTALEAYRMKVAGFVLAISVISAFVGSKAGAVLTALFGA